MPSSLYMYKYLNMGPLPHYQKNGLWIFFRQTWSCIYASWFNQYDQAYNIRKIYHLLCDNLTDDSKINDTKTFWV